MVEPWRWVARWAEASHERAVHQARQAAVECSRAAVERDEVRLWLEAHAVPAPAGPADPPVARFR